MNRRSAGAGRWPSANAAWPTGCSPPARLFLFLAFLVPLALIVYTSLQSGGLLSGGFSFTWEFSNYSSASVRLRRLLLEVPRDLGDGDGLLHPGRLPHGVLDRVLRGAVEVDVVLPDPGAVLRLVRDQDGAVEVHPGRRRPDLRSAEGPRAAAGELPDPADEDRGDLRGSRTTSCRSRSCRCTSRWSASTSAWSKPPRTCTRRGSRRSARWCCRCRSRACSPR